MPHLQYDFLQTESVMFVQVNSYCRDATLYMDRASQLLIVAGGSMAQLTLCWEQFQRVPKDTEEDNHLHALLGRTQKHLADTKSYTD